MTRAHKFIVGLASVALVTFAVQASAGQHVPLTDAQIKAQVEHKLSEEDGLRNVKVAVTSRVVTLDGVVPSLWSKEKAIEEARDVDDVDSVVSNLTIASAESDDVIGGEVAKRIRNYVFYSIFDNVDIGVNGGVVTLTGKVVQPYRSTEIERLVMRVPGVKEVNNQIEVLPTSITDDQLRASIASQIYNHTLFTKYAFQPNPPIHIIVDRGNVTLTGVVNSEVERRTAEFIVRHTFGVFKVDNQLRLDSMRSTRR